MVRRLSHDLAQAPADPGFPLRVMPDHQQPDLDRHEHAFTELVLVQAGQGLHGTDGGSYQISAGDCFVVQPGDAHGYADTKALVLSNVMMNLSILSLPLHDLQELDGYQALFTTEPSLRRLSGDSRRLRLDKRAMMAAIQLIRQLHAEARALKPGWRFAMRAQLMHLLLVLSRGIENKKQTCDAAVLQLARVIAHIDRSPEAPHCVAGLARMAEMKANAFLEQFKLATGTSPIDYVLRRRIALAMEQLQHSRVTITDIAYRCGFNDSNYFSRQFRKILGCSPRQWRSQQQL